MRTSMLVATVFGLALLSGCGPSRGSITGEGYNQKRYGFTVRSEGGAFLGPDRLLDRVKACQL